MASTAEVTTQSPPQQTAALDKKIDKGVASAIPLNVGKGGLVLSTMGDVMEFAKLMSVGKQAIPPHLRENPGMCLAVCIQAVEWRMSPFAVANKSYVVNDRLSFESQLIHAVVETRAPLLGRLKHEFIGEGAKRRCRVWAFVRTPDGPEMLEYTSPETGTIKPKNSPLWATKPDLQLYYNTSRDWARVYFPDVILGVYTDDELLDAMPQPAAASALPVGTLDLRAPKQPTNGTTTPPEAPPAAAAGEVLGVPAQDGTSPGDASDGDGKSDAYEGPVAGGQLYPDNGPY